MKWKKGDKYKITIHFIVFFLIYFMNNRPITEALTTLRFLVGKKI